MSRPLARFIYRLARKAAGDTTAFYSLKELHKRSGAKVPMRKFRQTIEEIVETAKTTPLPDYDLNLEDRGHDLVLHMRKRTEPPWRNGSRGDRLILSKRRTSVRLTLTKISGPDSPAVFVKKPHFVLSTLYIRQNRTSIRKRPLSLTLSSTPRKLIAATSEMKTTAMRVTP
ncbi:replication initiator protein A [Rhizobium mongolense]|uniref:replication initiator protein A n=1 Tax=Rhizobium mongolense TaxID=57676 RepID=UPI0034A14659